MFKKILNTIMDIIIFILLLAMIATCIFFLLTSQWIYAILPGYGSFVTIRDW
jgi:hypothetical protein